MTFKKVTYIDNETAITADNLNDIQDAIIDLDKRLSEIPATMGAKGITKDVAVFADKWEGETSPFRQVVTIPGVTKYTQVDVTPTAAQFELMRGKELAFLAENVDGVVTMKAIGEKPQNDYVLQVTMYEVSISEVSE